jgi:hypothetical protein
MVSRSGEAWMRRDKDEDEQLMFEMEREDDVACGGLQGDSRLETAYQRCRVCNTNFPCSTDYKLIVRRRRGRRSRAAVCDECRNPEASSDSSLSSEHGDDDEAQYKTSMHVCNNHMRSTNLPTSSAPPSTSAELDADTLNAILIRLVAGSGTAEQLCRCSAVCRTWYAGAINDELWRMLLRSRWGEGVQALDDTQQSYRAQYIRSVTTQVLIWGQTNCKEVDSVARPALVLNLLALLVQTYKY